LNRKRGRKLKKLFLFLILLFSFTAIVNAKGVQAKKYNHIVSLTLSGDEMLLGLVPENRIAGLSGKINEDKEISNIVDKAKKFTKVEGNVVTLEALKAANILTKDIQFAKVILAGEVKSAVTVRCLRVTKGAKAAIEAAGGSVEE